VNFAAGIGDSNPVYFDDEQPSGALVHPVLATSLTWQVAGRFWDFLPNSDFPVHLLLTQVHYSEYLQFHSDIRPGMVLTLQGVIAAIQPHRIGTLVVLCFEARGSGGEKVFTEYVGGLLRGVSCAGLGAGGENLPIIPKPTDSRTEPEWTDTISLSELAPYVFDACADVHFPIHTSPRFAHQVGLPGIIIQGTQILARAVSIIIQRQAGGNPRYVSTLACRFAGMVSPGESLQLRVWTEQSALQEMHLFFNLQKADGVDAIRGGYCRLLKVE
jgi:acyl dehydratase